MFEVAELGQKLSKKAYDAQAPILRERLLEVQARLRTADFPVIVLFAGVDGAGKGETANLLNAWMDPRGIVTHAYGRPSEEEIEQPRYWRFWRHLPPCGRIGIFLSAWYSRPLLRRVYEETTDDQYERELNEILSFEQMLAADGALILKFWMHLSRKAQHKRLKSLEQDPLSSWRVTKTDWKHWKKYDAFVMSAKKAISRTSTALAPWRIIEGADPRFRSIQLGTILLTGVERQLEARSRGVELRKADDGAEQPPRIRSGSVLAGLDLTHKLDKSDYKVKLRKFQGRLNRFQRKARARKLSTVVVFEGWDAAGKGGAIRRITSALDARDFEIITTGAPTDEERTHHYLWRFWRQLGRAGRFTIFDRSWYGRVLVERIEGFAADEEWRRAYAEINDFERQLVEHGIVLIKFWLHITPEEQERRFEERRQVPHKSWKLTEEDWRNREKWDSYQTAVNQMVGQTSTALAPWILVEAEDKRFARIKVLRAVCDALDRAF